MVGTDRKEGRRKIECDVCVVVGIRDRQAHVGGKGGQTITKSSNEKGIK